MKMFSKILNTTRFSGLNKKTTAIQGFLKTPCFFVKSSVQNKCFTSKLYKNTHNYTPVRSFWNGPFNNTNDQRITNSTNQISIQLELDNNTSPEIYANRELNDFVTRIYCYSGGGLFATVLGGIGLAQITEPHPFIAMGAGFVGAAASICAIEAFKSSAPDYIDYAKRKVSYLTLLASNSLMISPLFTIVPLEIVPTALGITSFITAGAVVYAKKNRDKDLQVYKSAAYGGLLGLLSLQLVGLGSYLVVGPNVLFDTLHQVDLYGGTLLFSGLLMYDTHTAINEYNNGKKDALGLSVSIYLDLMNLFIRILEIVARAQKK
jgi:FtsH-binding integral membrane protein